MEVFSVVIRSINDTDSNVQVMERFDNLDLNPNSANYIEKQIGNTYMQWNETERRLTEEGGGYPNRSKFVWVDINPAIPAGGVESSLVPFGYWGPPRPTAPLIFTGRGPGAVG